MGALCLKNAKENMENGNADAKQRKFLSGPNDIVLASRRRLPANQGRDIITVETDEEVKTRPRGKRAEYQEDCLEFRELQHGVKADDVRQAMKERTIARETLANQHALCLKNAKENMENGNADAKQRKFLSGPNDIVLASRRRLPANQGRDIITV